ncbi:MAG: hypothetical protein ACRDRB_04010 [Pseudonocardiaceae bacterium]
MISKRLTWVRQECGTAKTCPRVSDKTERGTRIVQGYLITDPALLAELGKPPSGESWVEVPDSLLSDL